MSDTELRLERLIAAPPERVFEFWSKPELLVNLLDPSRSVEGNFVSYTVATRGAARLSETPMAQGASAAADVTNAQAIGQVLYTNYVYFFQAAGLVLLVAMIGAIVLTLRHKPGVRRQVIMDQVLRTPATGMRMVSPKPGEGVVE